MNKRSLAPLAMILAAAVCVALAISQNGKNAPQGVSGTYTAGTYTATAQGFGPGGVTVEANFTDAVMTALTVNGPDETPEIGGAAIPTLVDAALAAQSAEFDGVSGATMTSGAVKEALASCIAQAKGEAVPAPAVETPAATEAPAEATPAPTEAPAASTPEPTPEATVEPSAEATVEPTAEATAEPSAEATAAPEPTAEPTVEPTPEPAAPKTYNAGTYTASAQGFGGAVTATVTVNDDAITDVIITGDGETPGLGGAALEPLAASAKEKGAAMDGVSGATVTSTAAKEAVSNALAQAKN